MATSSFIKDPCILPNSELCHKFVFIRTLQDSHGGYIGRITTSSGMETVMVCKRY